MDASVCFPICAEWRLSWLCTGHHGWCEFMSKAILSHSEDTFLINLLISGSYKLSTTFSLFLELWRRGYDTGVAFMAEFFALDQLLVSVFTTVQSTKAQRSLGEGENGTKFSWGRQRWRSLFWAFSKSQVRVKPSSAYVLSFSSEEGWNMLMFKCKRMPFIPIKLETKFLEN